MGDKCHPCKIKEINNNGKGFLLSFGSFWGLLDFGGRVLVYEACRVKNGGRLVVLSLCELWIRSFNWLTVDFFRARGPQLLLRIGWEERCTPKHCCSPGAEVWVEEKVF